METPQAPGWYDDPQQPDQLRYFDGVVWTQHVAPRRTRTGGAAADAGNTATAGTAPTPGTTPTPGGEPIVPEWERHPSQRSWHQPGPQGGGGAGAAPGGGAPGAPQGHWYPGGWTGQSGQPGPPTQPGWPGQGGPPGTGWPAPYAAPGQRVTPDGVPLAPYGIRVAAFFMDGIIRYLLVALFGGVFLYRAIQPMMSDLTDALANGDVQAYLDALGRIDAGAMAGFSVVSIAVAVVYNVSFLVRWGATPGKRIANISVRLRDRPGTPSFTTAVRRYGFVAVVNALGNVPGLGLLTLPVWAVDHLFPLWDPQRQALHDKVAGTVVVVGPQRRPGQ